MTYRISVDADECMSSGRCVADLPAVFAFDDDELAVVRDDAAEVDDGVVLRVARNCPSRAIVLHGGDGRRVDI